MSNKRIILISLILGLVAAVMVMFYLDNAKNASSNINYQKVVTAKQNIPSKTVVTRDMLELKNIPIDYVNSSAYLKISDVVGKTTKYEIITGEQILRQKIAGDKDISEGMSYTVPSGKRALTVSVNQVTGVNGFIKPGDFVDVAVTIDVDVPGGQKRPINKIIVQEVEVLAVENAVDGSAQKDNKTKETDLKTVTLLVDVNDSRQIMLGNDKGILHLILRAPSDKGRGTTDVFTTSMY